MKRRGFPSLDNRLCEGESPSTDNILAGVPKTKSSTRLRIVRYHLFTLMIPLMNNLMDTLKRDAELARQVF